MKGNIDGGTYDCEFESFSDSQMGLKWTKEMDFIGFSFSNQRVLQYVSRKSKPLYECPC